MHRSVVARIACVVVLIISLISTSVGAQTLPPSIDRTDEAADIIILAKNIITVDNQIVGAEGIAIAGNRILAVAARGDLEHYRGPNTQFVQVDDEHTVMPGLIDSHSHFVGLGQSLMMLDLRNQSTWDEIVADVKLAAAAAPVGTWIIGRGWHQSKWVASPDPQMDGYPLHGSLSDSVPDHPVLLTHASGHALFANEAAMRVARIDATTQSPAGGEIVKDATGNPTGLFRERAMQLIENARARYLLAASNEEKQAAFEQAVKLASEECLRNGITSFHDAGSSISTIDALRELAAAGKIPVRLYVMVRDSNDALSNNLARIRTIDAYEHKFTVRAIKKSLDGALGPHGAWLLSPYDDLPQSTGLATIDIEELEQAARIAADHDFQMCVHAIGDRANREVLDLYERILDRDKLRNARWRIEHAQHLDPTDIRRFGDLGVIAAMQGIHCTSDAPFVVTRMGFRRASMGAYVWRSLIDSGAMVCNGTDAPVEPLNPFPSIYASISRRLSTGATFFPEQAMTREEAIRSYTINSAFAAFDEIDRGSLTPGKLADIIVVDSDIATCDDQQLKDTEVVMTMVGGEIVYQRTPVSFQ